MNFKELNTNEPLPDKDSFKSEIEMQIHELEWRSEALNKEIKFLNFLTNIFLIAIAIFVATIILYSI